ncbi:DUF5667 domain-containing protein [Candidatus Parcubacteria bacterium]|nr:DUF5667 domain-containing protein [Candidatus Parcubacteria bacterium]
MNNKELINSLKQLKTLKDAGATRPEFLARNKEILLMQIKNNGREEQVKITPAYIWQAVQSIMPDSVFNFVVKPVLTAMVIFGIVFGGWAATVSASYNSLPGDMLYTVKIMAENAQVSLTSKNNEVPLRAEFAARRLEEMRKILEAPYTENTEANAMQAVQDFNKQITAVKSSLEDIGGQNTPSQAVEAARIVDRKTEEYGTALQKATEISSSTSVHAEVKKATDAVNDAGIKAIEVIVKKTDGVLDDALMTKVGEKIKVVEAKVNEVREDTENAVAQGATIEADAVMVQAKEAFDNNDMATVVDKLVEAKNLVNTVSGPIIPAVTASSTLEQVPEMVTTTVENASSTEE